MLERVGVLVVHGIGTQYRFQHLRNVVDNFVRAAARLYGDGNVSVEIPGVGESNLRAVFDFVPRQSTTWKGTSPAPISVLIRSNAEGGIERDVCVDFREMWWGDLSLGSGRFRALKFWGWAISLSGSRGYFFQSQANSDMRSPSKLERLSLRYRLELFAWTTIMFLLMLPMEVVARMVAFIPGFARLNVFRTVFSFMSAVKMYQERVPGAELSDFDQVRRASVERRMSNQLVDMALDNYDRWYIFGHSLGSVIAYKSLMARGTTLARYMSCARWEADYLWNLKGTSDDRSAAPDEAKCPHWLPADAVLKREKVFEKFRGFFSYGSPLEIFARIWPAITPINLEAVFQPDTEWINVYDPADVVAMRSILSFSHPEADRPGQIRPTNFAYASSILAYQSHTGYLWLRARSRPKFVSSVVQWVVGGEGGATPFTSVAEREGLRPLNPILRRSRVALAIVEGVAVTAIGCALVPTALAYLARLLNAGARVLGALWDPNARGASELIPDPDQFFHSGFEPVIREPLLIATEDGLVFVVLLGIVLFMSTVHYASGSFIDWRSWPGEQGQSDDQGGVANSPPPTEDRPPLPPPRPLRSFAWVVALLFIAMGAISSGYLFWPTAWHAAVAENMDSTIRVPPPEAEEVTNEQAKAQALEKVRNRPPMLRAFLQRMPKGADLHTHLSGAVYAENYIRWAADDKLCVDGSDTLVGCDQGAMRVADAIDKDASLYGKLVDAWSLRRPPGDRAEAYDRFFSVFRKFRLAIAGRQGDMLAEIARNAAAQNVMYLEIMLTLQGDSIGKYSEGLSWDGDLDALQAKLSHRGLDNLLGPAREELDKMEARERQLLHCDSATPDPGCNVMIRYLQQVDRTYRPEQVFAALLLAQKLARSDSRVVGFNLVAPEDNPTALGDYRKQMTMLDFLWRQWPDVKASLHAGELAIGMVPLNDLRSHLRLAVEEGHARRIGHGIALGFDDDANGLLHELADRDVLVEINLTSNSLILGVKGDDHPLLDYLSAGVPVAICTDDEGISRSDLTNEYELAVRDHNLSYADLKLMARASIAHSFLPGRSVWRSVRPPQTVEECEQDVPGTAPVSGPCRDFLDHSPLATEEWELERRLLAFEARP